MNTTIRYLVGLGIGLLWAWAPQTATAQVSNQARNIAFAEELYSNGQMDKAIEYLHYWLNDDEKLAELRSNNQAELYRLAAHCYILLDQPDSAKIYIKKMLRIWPQYKKGRVRPYDVDGFLLALDTLYALPKYFAGVRTGANLSYINISKTEQILSYEQHDLMAKFTPELGYQVAAFVERDFGKYFGAGFEVAFEKMSNSYERTNNGTTLGDEVKLKQQLSYIQTGLWAQAKPWPEYKLRPYLQIGPAVALLRNALIQEDTKDLNLEVISSMHTLLYGVQVSAGFAYNLGLYSIGLDVGFNHFFNLVNDPTKRYINDPASSALLYGLYYAPDDIYLNNLQLSLAFRYYIDYNVFSKKRR